MTGLAVAAVIEGVGGSLDELPPVLASLAQIFSARADRLQALQTEGLAALARASSRSEAIESARSALVMSRSAVSALERQHAVARAGAGIDPLTASQLGSLEPRLWSARVRLDAAEHAHSHAVAGLALSREEHAALVDYEMQLMGATWIALHHIGLGDLRDSDGLFDTLSGWVRAAWGVDGRGARRCRRGTR